MKKPTTTPVTGNNQKLKSLQITCNRYSTNNISNYTLSIQLGLGGLSFAIRDYLSNCYIHFEHHPDAGLKQPLANLQKCLAPVLSEDQQYKQVYLVIDEPRVSILPQNLQSDDAIQSFFKLNHELEKDEEVLAFSKDAKLPVNCFALNSSFYTYFTSTFANLNVRHFTDVTLWTSKAFHQEAKGHISLSIFNRHFYLTATKNDKVLLNNSIPFNSHSDLLFLLLNAFTKLGFDQYTSVVTINGQVERTAELINEMKRFIHKVQFEEWPAAFNFIDDFFKMPPYYYSTLFLAPLCE